MSAASFIPYRFERLTVDEMLKRAELFFETLNRRRSIRDFSADPVPRRAIERLAAARDSGTGPPPLDRLVAPAEALDRLASLALPPLTEPPAHNRAGLPLIEPPDAILPSPPLTEVK